MALLFFIAECLNILWLTIAFISRKLFYKLIWDEQKCQRKREKKYLFYLNGAWTHT